MAFDNNQKDGTADPNAKRKTEQHLPKYFRTVSNSKFLSSTIDQLVQPGVVEKLNGYYGRETAASFNKDDNYIGDFSDSRQNYQFEPAAVIKDNLGAVKFIHLHPKFYAYFKILHLFILIIWNLQYYFNPLLCMHNSVYTSNK